MRIIRLFAYFLVGVMLSSVAVFSFAETTAPISITGYRINQLGTLADSTTPAGACIKAQTVYTAYTYQSVSQSSGDQFTCYYSAGFTLLGGTFGSTGCPAGQNWTYTGGQCTRPDCVAPNVRDVADGVCKPPATPCEMFPGSASTPVEKPANCSCPAGTQWVGMSGCRKKCDSSQGAGIVANAGFDLSIAKGQSEACFAGCLVQHSAGAFDILKDGSHSAPATYTGWACPGNGAGTASTPDGQPQKDTGKINPADKHAPKCGSGEGVITSSSGNVMCLPSGTPNTSTPKVETAKKTEVFPDNTTKTTETTKTTDPNTGATHTATTSTATSKADGTAGDAGAPGTTTGVSGSGGTDKTGDGVGDGDGECAGNDCGSGKTWPEVSGLWEKKYPDGITGVLTAKMTVLKNTGFYKLTDQLIPANLPSSGTCPAYSFNFNMGPKMNFGGIGLNMPCGVWDFIRMVFLITAGLAARRLIFGG